MSYKNMRITITGPRSVGKTTVSKIVAKKLRLKYISSDEIAEKALKKHGGLDKATKSGVIETFIQDMAYDLIKKEYQKENFVFDLAGGSISSKKHEEVSEKGRKIVKENSIVIGLLPSKNNNESVTFLFEREKEREHFKVSHKKGLLDKTKKDYKKFPLLFKGLCHFIIYVKGKTPEQIAQEIIERMQLKKYKLLLIRHGESIANAKVISQGNNDEWTDTPLSKKGKEQAKRVAERLRKEKIEVIYSSDLRRAEETAKEINKFHHVKIKLDKRLRDKLNNENHEEFIKKCKNSFKDIEKENKNVLVVAHGSSCLTLLAITTGNRKKGGKIVREHASKHRNTCVSMIEKKGKSYKIKLIGCTKHLDKTSQ